ncbi:class I SAM-dependent rRNA methyltransferase [Thiorhodococcus mannitoliphagus]|uniref:Class I SAM-dependent rRNA methyltransferase n=1 Tax=Thiorhodococcus mannitoliphagus TaxID=329406 RepID=A0A6P1DV55_9GAMM|nr:class I SAM-dependent rRNA methyltransferase [Thiorhodococcus mannitoliphagus]NEX19584.1 class I SAM-dependent rRNA methyltransferase [Thiorhodococcus mannitoliphagus]
MTTQPLILRKDQERRLLAGHCWIYSNEVDTQATPLKTLEPGQPVEILSRQERWIGHGYANPRALLCARIVSRDPDQPLSPALWLKRIHDALSLRERLYDKPFYRLVFGESDGLPGLIVDRYGDLLAVQITTAGMERERGEILAALEQIIRPKTMVLRNDTAVRELEGLAQGVESILGEPEDAVPIVEHGLELVVSPLTGQKTGWFFDQAENRGRLARYGVGERVLDVCSYIGAWGLRAAALGAKAVTCVDVSQSALERVADNAALNKLDGRVQGLHGDAFEVLRALRDEGRRFDTVILDPPAFIKRRKDEKDGTQAYQRLNRLGMEVLEPGGLLITSSCSFHMGRDTFLRTVQQAARRAGRSLQLLEAGQQGPDHPVHPAIPETAYLKTFFLRVIPGF